MRAIRNGDWKLVVDSNHEFVFNLRRDIGEREDLTNRRQDIAHKLRPMLAQWERDIDAEAAANFPEITTLVTSAPGYLGRGGRGAPAGAAGRGQPGAPGRGQTTPAAPATRE